MVSKESGNNLHIALVGPIYTPSLSVDFGTFEPPLGMGGEPVNLLLNSLLARGFRVTVVTLTPEVKDLVSFDNGKVKVIFGPYRASGKQRVFDFFKQERKFIKAQIESCRPDVVHAHWQYEWGWGALSSKSPTLLTCHDSPLHILKYQPDVYRIFRLIVAFIVLKKATYLTTVSHSCEKGLKFLTNKPMYVVPNFESNLVFNKYRSRTLNKTRKVRIVMINNGFTSLKNVHIGILAFLLLNQRHDNLELYLYGSSFELNGVAHKWTMNMSDKGDNIYFKGKYDFTNLMSELADCDILLHTSRHESFGMVLVEAMAMGIPVVAGQNSGGVCEILSEGGGVLVEVKDPLKVAAGLEFLLIGENYATESIVARKVATERYREDSVVNLYLNIYRRIIEET